MNFKMINKLIIIIGLICVQVVNAEWKKIDIFSYEKSIQVRYEKLANPIIFEWGLLINDGGYSQIDFEDVIKESYISPDTLEEAKLFYTDEAWSVMGITPDNYNEIKKAKASIENSFPSLRYMMIFEIIDVVFNGEHYKFLIHENSQEIYSERIGDYSQATILKLKKQKWLNDVFIGEGSRILKLIPLNADELNPILKSGRGYYLPGGKSINMKSF